MWFKYAFDAVENVGFGVIKNSAKVVWGVGETVVGATMNDDELREKGMKHLGETIILLAAAAFKIFTGEDHGDNSEDEEGNF